MSTGTADFAAAIVQGQQGGVSLRAFSVAAVNAGPPKSVDLAQEFGGPAVLLGIRYSNSYHQGTPAVGDHVMVLVSQSGGSGRQGGRNRGGNAFVVDKVAV